MQVSKEKDKLVIEFPFDKTLVTVVGSFPGRRYSAKTKKWRVPSIHAEKVVSTLQHYDFQFTKDVMKEYEERVKRHRKIQRIKKGLFNSIEQNALKQLDLPLYEYQKIGAGFICVGKRVIIADQPGLGKTLQSLSAVSIRNAEKVLIFAPKTAKKTWGDEIKKWLNDDSVVVVSGSPKERQEQWNSDSRFYICNYHQLLRDLEYMKSIDWDFIISDEATDVSNPEAKMTKALKKLEAEYKIALTGTPVSNTIKDIWSIVDWVQPGLLGTYGEFTREYCVKDAYGSIVSYKNIPQLKAKIEPYFLRRLKSNVLTELPPKTYENIYTEFSKDEQKLYEAIQDEIMNELVEMGMNDRRYLSKAFVKMLRLKQMTGSSELINGNNVSSKLEDLRQLLGIILSNNEKAIIFTQFSSMADILIRELKEYNPLLIAGKVPDDERSRNQDAFNEDDTHKLLIMTSAGSRSLNLQRASYVIHYDLPWSISQTEQREDRAHRNGQKNNVTIYRMLVRNTIDEYTLGTLFSKQSISDQVLKDNTTDKIPNATDQDVKKILTR